MTDEGFLQILSFFLFGTVLLRANPGLARVLDSSPNESQPAEPFLSENTSFCSLSSPIFEEDTPSVMEIEMEELDKWMNSMNRKGTWKPKVLV